MKWNFSMLLEILTSGIHPKQPISTIIPTSLGLNYIDLFLPPFEFESTIQIVNLPGRRITHRVIPPDSSPTNQRLEEFRFPIVLPRSGEEYLRIGLVQNVTRRKDIARWGQTTRVLTDLTHRLLDTLAEYSRPFFYDPYFESEFTRVNTRRQQRPVPRANASGVNRLPGNNNRELPKFSGYNLLLYPNGQLSEVISPWPEPVTPRIQASNSYKCIYDDIPGSRIYLNCQGRDLREFRIAQTQQMFVTMSRNNAPFEILIATSLFTVFTKIKLNPPPRGQSFSGPQIDYEYTYYAFVPWEESVENFPNDRQSFSRWQQRRWNQLRRQHRWVGTGMGVRLGTSQALRRSGVDVQMVTSGQTANDYINSSENSYQCSQAQSRYL